MALTYADVAEGVKAALAAYTQALDDGRTDDVVATFCPDGACEIPGLGHHRGHSGWTTQLVGRYHDTLHYDEGVWRFHHRAATFVTDRPSPKGNA
jgi:hypothetical protein